MLQKLVLLSILKENSTVLMDGGSFFGIIVASLRREYVERQL